MALRLGRPELAVVALDSVQHNLQRQLRYRAATDSARRRVELARGAGDLGELGDSYAVAAWNAYYLGEFEEARVIGREGYDAMRADGPHLRRALPFVDGGSVVPPRRLGCGPR